MTKQHSAPGAHVAIGVLAGRTGCSVPTTRYYEEIGLIPPAARRPSGHRVYGRETEDLLVFIRRCRDVGFPIEPIRALVTLRRQGDRDCDEARELAQAHLDEVRGKLAELRALERSLDALVRSCAEECAGGPTSDCTLFRDLGAMPSPGGCCGG